MNASDGVISGHIRHLNPQKKDPQRIKKSDRSLIKSNSPRK